MLETSVSFLPTAVTVNVVFPEADLVCAKPTCENSRAKTSSAPRTDGNLNGLIGILLFWFHSIGCVWAEREYTNAMKNCYDNSAQNSAFSATFCGDLCWLRYKPHTTKRV